MKLDIDRVPIRRLVDFCRRNLFFLVHDGTTTSTENQFFISSGTVNDDGVPYQRT